MFSMRSAVVISLPMFYGAHILDLWNGVFSTGSMGVLVETLSSGEFRADFWICVGCCDMKQLLRQCYCGSSTDNQCLSIDGRFTMHSTTPGT